MKTSLAIALAVAALTIGTATVAISALIGALQGLL
jgi:hypothetical protein